MISDTHPISGAAEKLYLDTSACKVQQNVIGANLLCRYYDDEEGDDT